MIFKNYKEYCKETGKPYMYYRYWKHNYARIKVVVFINRLKNRIHDFISQS